jgi:hypothetical protein
MKFPFDPQHLDVPITLAYQILGAITAIGGIIATTMYGLFHSLAFIPPEDLAIQPLHVVLIGFIIALAGFIVLILRAVWGKGIDTVNRLSRSQESFVDKMDDMLAALKHIADVQNHRLAKLEELSYDALRDATIGVKASKK